MLADYHLHTFLCGHASGTPEEYVRRAQELGLPEIGFADHAPLPFEGAEGYRMGPEKVPEYAAAVRRCREAFPGLPIRFGIEADYHPSAVDYVTDFLKANDFDYVIGSIHYINGWGFDDPLQKHHFENRDINEVYACYYDLVARLAATGLYDILGHADVVKKYGHRPSRDISDLERAALEAVARAGMALDVNTSGLRRTVAEIYPSLRILRTAREMGIGIVFGSDAHQPGEVGMDFDRALAHVRAAGYTHCRRYAGRRHETVPLDSAARP